MSTKQKIILRYYRDGDSQRKISRDLKIYREIVNRYLAECERVSSKLSSTDVSDKALIENSYANNYLVGSLYNVL